MIEALDLRIPEFSFWNHSRLCRSRILGTVTCTPTPDVRAETRAVGAFGRCVAAERGEVWKPLSDNLSAGSRKSRVPKQACGSKEFGSPKPRNEWLVRLLFFHQPEQKGWPFLKARPFPALFGSSSLKR